MRWPTRRRVSRDGRIRVAYLTAWLGPGGAERQMLYLARALPRDRFEVSFITMADPGPWGPRAEALGVRVHALDLPRGARLGAGAIWRIGRAIVRYRRLSRSVDIVDAWLVPASTFAALAQPLARVPVLMAGRRSMLAVYAGRSRARRWLAAWAARRAKAVVANASGAAAEAVDHEGVRRERVHVIANAVEPIPADPGARDRLRAGWACDPDALVVGVVANLKPGKGFDTLLDAAAALRAAAPQLRYVLVGDGALRSTVERGIEARGIGDILRLTGTVDDARTLYPAFRHGGLGL